MEVPKIVYGIKTWVTKNKNIAKIQAAKRKKLRWNVPDEAKLRMKTNGKN
jgi:hypothetical protein